jgi:hypothetical protein
MYAKLMEGVEFAYVGRHSTAAMVQFLKSPMSQSGRAECGCRYAVLAAAPEVTELANRIPPAGHRAGGRI